MPIVHQTNVAINLVLGNNQVSARWSPSGIDKGFVVRWALTALERPRRYAFAGNGLVKCRYSKCKGKISAIAEWAI